ncbi:MAG: lipopolysaccharide biosynthesis protein [Armatimonadota bacterium]
MDRTEQESSSSQRTGEAPSVSTDEARRHFLGNAVSNLAFFLFNIATSFAMVPYQISHLGLANYGMVTLALSFTMYTQVLTVVLTTTLFRFVVIHVARGDMNEARDYFNTQLIATGWFIAIFLPISCVVSYYTPRFLQIPAGQSWNTRILFVAMYVSFLISLGANPFRVAQFARQRFDLGNWVQIGGQLVRYSTWIVLFSTLAPALWQVGLGFVLESTFVLIVTILIFERLLPQLRPALTGFNRAKFIDMVKMGGWLVVNQIGVILYLSVDLLIINRLLGPGAVGEYSPVLGIAIMLRGLSSTMSGMITPLAISSYARHDYETLVRHMSRAVKLVSLGMAIPLGTLCGIAAPFLVWWLGPQAKGTYPLVWWLLAHQVITCGVEPLYSITTAANRMAAPGISTVLGGLLKVVLSIVLVEYTGLGYYGVAVGGFCAFILKNAFFAPWYAAYVLQRSSRPFYAAMLPALFTFGAAAAAALGLVHVLNPTDFWSLAATAFVTFGASGLGVYYLAMDRSDRRFLNDVARRGGKQPSESAVC